MNKELETFKKIKTEWDSEGYLLKDWMDDNDINIVENGLKRLESIDNAKPSEALKCLEWVSKELKIYYEHLYIIQRDTKKELILKKKKANEYLDTIKQALLKAQELKSENSALLEENNDLYVELAFAEKQYKELTEYIKQYKKILDIIKEKDVDIYILRKCKTVDEYNSKIVHIVGETRELTEEEFKLLKEVLE